MRQPLKPDVETYMDAPLANQMLVVSNWSSLRYYHSIFYWSGLSGFPLSSSATRYRSARIATRVVLHFARGQKTVTFRNISDNRHSDPRLSKPASFDYLVLVEIGHRWCFKRPCPPVGCAAEWYAKPTMWRLWKCLLGKWNGYNFSNNKETD